PLDRELDRAAARATLASTAALMPPKKADMKPRGWISPKVLIAFLLVSAALNQNPVLWNRVSAARARYRRARRSMMPYNSPLPGNITLPRSVVRRQTLVVHPPALILLS